MNDTRKGFRQRPRVNPVLVTKKILHNQDGPTWATSDGVMR